MTSRRTSAIAVLATALAAALAIGDGAAFAAPQSPPPPTSPPAPPAPPVRPPLVDIHPTPASAPKPSFDRYKGRVLVFNMAQIMVQSMDNEKMIWSFQYSPELRAQIADMLGTGGFQYGDKIQVYCNPGTTVAVRLKGRHLKSS